MPEEKSSLDYSWDFTIESKTRLLNFNFLEIWKYRDLIYYFVKRDFVAFYKQTILGPLWYIVQPLASSLVMYVVFTKIASIATGGIPPFLFYLSGNILWSYFSDNLTRASDTFILNTGIFGKVYFPRLTVPLSSSISGLISFLMQFFIFMIVFMYYYLSGAIVHPTIWVIFLPILIIYMALVGFSIGIIISALTTKYRDLIFVLKFGLQLWMFASPVAYSTAQVPKEYLGIYLLNPVAPIIEIFRSMFFNSSILMSTHILLSASIGLILLVLSLILFNRVEKSFLDTI